MHSFFLINNKAISWNSKIFKYNLMIDILILSTTCGDILSHIIVAVSNEC